MRILYLTPYVPTPIRVRPYNLLKTMAGRGHDITLLCIAQGEGLAARRPSAREQAALAELGALGVDTHAVVLPRWRSLLNCLLAIPTRTPLQAVYCWSPRLARLLRAELDSSLPAAPAPAPHAPSPEPFAPGPEPYALLHIEHLRGARYGFQLPTSNLQPPIIWDSVDCISHLFTQSAQRSRSLFGRLVTRLELPRTRRYESKLLQRFARALVTSAVDQQAFAALVPEPQAATCNLQPATVLPNGVDLSYFSPDDTPRQQCEVAFSGKMSYHANVTAALYFAREVLPLIQEREPAAHLTIIGSEPTPEVRAVAGPAVAVTGHVADVRPYLRRAAVAVAPMPYGAGIQNKVLEAMACATPVVATPQAVSALSARPGEEVLVGETAAELAAHVVGLLSNPARACEIGRAGRAYVERCHDWSTVAGLLEQVYDEEVARRAPLPNRG